MHEANYENIVASQHSATQINCTLLYLLRLKFMAPVCYFFFLQKKNDLAKSHLHVGVRENVNIKPKQALFRELMVEMH